MNYISLHVDQRAQKAPVWVKASLYFLAFVEIALSSGMIAGGLVDFGLVTTTHSKADRLALGAYLATSFLSSPFGIVSGIISAVSTRLVRKKSALMWTAIHWGCFVFLSVYFVALVVTLSEISLPIKFSAAGINIFSAIILFKLAFCVCFTCLNRLGSFERSGC